MKLIITNLANQVKRQEGITMKRLFFIPAILLVSTVMATVPGQYEREFFICNGSATTFNFTFKIFATSDLALYLRDDAAGTETLLTLNSHYTLSATNNNYANGGTITTTATYASGYTLVAARSTTVTQEASFRQNRALENTIDRLTLMVQDLYEKYEQCLRMPMSDPASVGGELTNSIDRKGKWLAFSSADGSPTVSTGTLNTTDYPVSSFVTSLLDDTTAAQAMVTLGGMVVYNVQTYGAAGNGVTDDTLAIQNTIDAAETAGGGLVLLPQGTYVTSSTLQVGSNVILLGSGEYCTIVSVDSDTVGIQTDASAYGWKIIGLAVNVGDSAVAHYTSNAIVVGNNCYSFEIADVTVGRDSSSTYKWQDALVMTNAWTATVRRFRCNGGTTRYVLNTAGWAIHYDQCDFSGLGITACAYVTGNANTFTACKFQGRPVGLYINGGDRNLITCPWFENDYAASNIWCVDINNGTNNVFVAGSYTADTRLSGGYIRLQGTSLYNRWVEPWFGNTSDADSVLLKDSSQWNTFVGGNVRWATCITPDSGGNHYTIESFNSNEQIARYNYGDTTGEWHFGDETGGIKLEQGVSSVSSDDPAGLYATTSGGSAPFDASGNLIIKPKNTDGLSVEIWTGATPNREVKISNSGTEIGQDGVTRGALSLWDGAGGNTPGYFSMGTPNGTIYYYFTDDSGNFRRHTAIPTQNSDGVIIGP